MSSNIRTVGIVVAVLVLVGVIAVAREAGSGKDKIEKESRLPATKTQSGLHARNYAPKLSAILLVNSLSCPCTRERCRDAEALMEVIKPDFEDVVTFETVDWELQHDRAEAFLSRYKVFLIPTLLVLDGEGDVVWRCEDFSQEEGIYSKFKQFAGETPEIGQNK